MYTDINNIMYTWEAIKLLPEDKCARNVTIADIAGIAGVKEIARLWKYTVLCNQYSSFFRISVKLINIQKDNEN